MTWGPAHIIANWKMHGTMQTCQRLVFDLLEQIEAKNLRDDLSSHLKIHLCPSFPYLPLVKHMTMGHPLHLGAQDMHYEEQGPFTGAVGPYMLKDVGCDLVILGHSERRAHFRESPTDIGQKVAKAAEKGLTPVLCVGEDQAAYAAKKTFSTVLEQIRETLARVPQSTKLLIAYEPIWAIGAGKTPAATEVNQLFEDLGREKLIQKYYVTFLYGGSVNGKNVGSFLTQPYINGVLVGGVSLQSAGFTDLLETASQVVRRPKGTWSK
ncbi:triose-phosphate isomerase [Alphaproteobacteria bacterium]|nr:triose-phosphate isomerase [Alphaproteobacteria bacterium]